MDKKTVVAIGVFDGVHIGHKKILHDAVKIAKRNNTKSIALTFYPHPLSVVDSNAAPLSLISLKHRLNLIKDIGIDKRVVFNFTKGFSNFTAEIFIKNVLVKKLNAGWVVVGENFSFGKHREGDCNLLKDRGRVYGFKVAHVKTLTYKGKVISSSFIRRLIQSGDLDLAKRLLGRPVEVLGTVVKGNEIGRELGFPTANINPHHEIVPPSGVYIVKVNIDKHIYNGVLNIGVRPTFYGNKKQDKEPTIEVFIFNFKKNIYKKDIEVKFIKRIRSEKKFKSRQDLIQQIKLDVTKARKCYAN